MNYQEKVSTRADVRALYERVIKQPNIERYRGYTSKNSYGWDAEVDDYIKKSGEVWFDNPAYSFEVESGWKKISETLDLLHAQFAAVFDILREQHCELLQKDREIKMLKEKIHDDGGDFE